MKEEEEKESLTINHIALVSTMKKVEEYRRSQGVAIHLKEAIMNVKK